ncbi:hypothetical protein F7725_018428 [Dissostichus mawsoni]|uniref:Uncharacterized protein n=1 Tax=Dissostichus mawsoni TaxID=36200 RepID=A0A7J5XS72_DISMA|nr:hypothetical protein F7725_018428 [Dissostichus mawsoni]
MDMNSSWTYIQSVCGEADLRHLHVERALVIAQSACRRTETAGSDVDGIVGTLTPPEDCRFYFQSVYSHSEDAISQGVHNVIERGFIGHIEKVLLSADVMTQNLEASVREKEPGLAGQAGSGCATPAAVLSRQPPGPAQLISVFFYPVTFLPGASSAICPSVCTQTGREEGMERGMREKKEGEHRGKRESVETTYQESIRRVWSERHSQWGFRLGEGGLKRWINRVTKGNLWKMGVQSEGKEGEERGEKRRGREGAKDVEVNDHVTQRDSAGGQESNWEHRAYPPWLRSAFEAQALLWTETLLIKQKVSGSGNEQQESVEVLAISFKNGKEIKRKIYSVQSTNHLLEPTQEPVLLNGLTDLLKKKFQKYLMNCKLMAFLPRRPGSNFSKFASLTW